MPPKQQQPRRPNVSTMSEGALRLEIHTINMRLQNLTGPDRAPLVTRRRALQNALDATTGQGGRSGGGGASNATVRRPVPKRKFPSEWVVVTDDDESDVEQEDHPPVSIFVRVLGANPKQVTVRTSMSNTVPRLKKELAGVTGIPVENQRIMFEGSVLDRRIRLKDYGVRKDSTIFVEHRAVRRELPREEDVPGPEAGKKSIDVTLSIHSQDDNEDVRVRVNPVMTFRELGHMIRNELGFLQGGAIRFTTTYGYEYNGDSESTSLRAAGVGNGSQVDVFVGTNESQPLDAPLKRFMSDENEFDAAPPEFICPITSTLMNDPVTADDNKNYEREAIKAWIQRTAPQITSPLTRQPMSAVLRPNKELKKEILQWRRRHRDQRPLTPTPPESPQTPPSITVFDPPVFDAGEYAYEAPGEGYGAGQEGPLDLLGGFVYARARLEQLIERLGQEHAKTVEYAAAANERFAEEERKFMDEAAEIERGMMDAEGSALGRIQDRLYVNLDTQTRLTDVHRKNMARVGDILREITDLQAQRQRDLAELSSRINNMQVKNEFRRLLVARYPDKTLAEAWNAFIRENSSFGRRQRKVRTSLMSFFGSYMEHNPSADVSTVVRKYARALMY